MTLFVVAEGFFDVALARFKTMSQKEDSCGLVIAPLLLPSGFWVEKLKCRSFAASSETYLFFALRLGVFKIKRD